MRRSVFLDRDGVINVKPADGEYVRSWDEFHFIPETIDWIRLFNALDLLVIVITNQRGVARGLMQQCELDSIHAKMVEDLAQRGAHVDDVFYCMRVFSNQQDYINQWA
ncbi:MAG: HAD-IIIA family hydrolase [Planctomycetia bacterium]|nr:HAD-IIIA family hydrolase [Planctomycetia bacterium]